MSAQHSVFQSRWGCHPVDYPTYRKLKFLNAVYHQAVRMAHAWQRWQRKDPHNRVARPRIRNEKRQVIGYESPIPLAEPPLCALFSQKIHVRCSVDKKGRYYPEGYLVERVQTNDLGIPMAHATARMPVPDAREVLPLRLSKKEIEELYDKARAWLEHQDAK